jgi:hypothetical protein
MSWWRRFNAATLSRTIWWGAPPEIPATHCLLTVWFRNEALRLGGQVTDHTAIGHTIRPLRSWRQLTSRAMSCLPRRAEGLSGFLMRLLRLDFAIPGPPAANRDEAGGTTAVPLGPHICWGTAQGLKLDRGGVDRNPWHEPAEVMAQTAHRAGCQRWPDRRGSTDRGQRRRSVRGLALARPDPGTPRFVPWRRRIQSGRRLRYVGDRHPEAVVPVPPTLDRRAQPDGRHLGDIARAATGN